MPTGFQHIGLDIAKVGSFFINSKFLTKKNQNNNFTSLAKAFLGERMRKNNYPNKDKRISRLSALL